MHTSAATSYGRNVYDLDPPVGSLLTLAEAKDELSIFDTGVEEIDNATDARVTAMIEAATSWCEQYCSRTFRERANREMRMATWPREGTEVVFFAPPLAEVHRVAYQDSDGIFQTVPTDQYSNITPTRGRGRLVFNHRFTYPAHREGVPDGVKYQYYAGYGLGAELPAVAKQAARLILSRWWDADRDPATLENYERAAEAMLEGLKFGDYQ